MACALEAFMKPVRVDFVGNRAWLLVWSAAGLIVLAMVGVTAWQGWREKKALEEILERVAAVQARLDQLSAPQLKVSDPRYASAERAARVLQFDPNKPFAAIESLNQPEVRLQNLSLDSVSGTLRLEYELPSVASASAITAALNASYDVGPWRLESATAAAKGFLIGSMRSQVVRGIWSVQLDKL